MSFAQFVSRTNPRPNARVIPSFRKFDFLKDLKPGDRVYYERIDGSEARVEGIFIRYGSSAYREWDTPNHIWARWRDALDRESYMPYDPDGAYRMGRVEDLR